MAVERCAGLMGAGISARAISRRALLKAGAAVALASTGVATARSTVGVEADQRGVPASIDWQQFDATVQAALQTFGVVGAAVAVVNRTGVLHVQTFGERVRGKPVTPGTLFPVASVTKSMTALMVATFVDDGTVSWDEAAIQAWPDFRAPSDELTRTLRVRDLLGMATGLGSTEAADLTQFYFTAIEAVQSVAYLPVLGPPGTVFFYNNPVYAAGGYLPFLARGSDPASLLEEYRRFMQQRLFGPAGMSTARIADDPRPFSDDYAVGYALDLLEGMVAEPRIPAGGFAPVGATLASVTDMAGYVRTQLGRGVSPTGTRVVSEANLVETWKPHIENDISAQLDPDLVQAGYAMGLISQTYRDGRRLVWHNGGIDGFTSFAGFFPDDDLGLVVLTNAWVAPGGSLFYTYVLNLLLGGAFGLNVGVNDSVLSLYRDVSQRLLDKGAQAGPVDTMAIAPYLGYYEHGYTLAFDDAGALRLSNGPRATRVLAGPDGSFMGASGILAGYSLRIARTTDGGAQLTIGSGETVNWQRGL